MGSRRRRVVLVAVAAVTATAVAACTSSDGDADPTPAPQTHAAVVPITAPPTTLTVPPQRRTGWGPTYGELAKAESDVARMSDRELVGQLFVASYSGTTAPVALVRRFHLGGVIAMSGNIVSVDQITSVNARLQKAGGGPWPLVIGVDQEGGTVERVGAPMTQFPTYMSIGAAADRSLATKVARATGEELRAAGFTLVYAPDADVTIGPADPTIGTRSVGDRPQLVAQMVTASLAGYRRSGIVAVAKHFPGHGSVTTNSHHALPHQSATVERLEHRDWMPFAAAIKESVPAVMVGHISLDRVDPGVPADLSRPDLALLRDRLGFDGLVTTDALNMAAIPSRFSPARAAVAALRAGVDELLMPPRLGAAYRGVLDALRDGRLDRAQLELSAARAGALMLHEAGVRRPTPDVVGSHTGLSYAESARALTLVSGACHGPYVGSSVRPVGEPNLVSTFTSVAEQAGLDIVTKAGTKAGRKATVVALLDEDPPRHTPDVAVSTTRPYVLAGVPARTRIALFGSTHEAMAALVAVLTGHAQAQGHLPVTVLGPRPPQC